MLRSMPMPYRWVKLSVTSTVILMMLSACSGDDDSIDNNQRTNLVERTQNLQNTLNTLDHLNVLKSDIIELDEELVSLSEQLASSQLKQSELEASVNLLDSLYADYDHLLASNTAEYEITFYNVTAKMNRN